MEFEKIALNGMLCAAYYMYCSEKNYLPSKALAIQSSALGAAVLLKEGVKPSNAGEGLSKYDLIPYIFVSASLYWTGISKKAQIISTAVLGTAPIVADYFCAQAIGVDEKWRYSEKHMHIDKKKKDPIILEMPAEVQVNGTTVSPVFGDILDLPVEAIVNAANEKLHGGSGIDGAIHAAAGTELKDECAKFPLLKGHPTDRIVMGDAVITPSFKITGRDNKTTHVVHTVGPRGSTPKRKDLLENAYRNSLEVAAKHGLRSIAFPAISVGIFSYPFEEAQEIAYKTVKDYLEKNPGQFDHVIFVYRTVDINKPLHTCIQRIWEHTMQKAG